MHESFDFISWLLISIRVFSFFLVFASLRAYVGIVSLASISLVLGTFLSTLLTSKLAEVSGVLFFAFALREVLIGVLLAIPLAISLHAFRIAGRVADVSRGNQMGEQLNPGIGEQMSSLESMIQLLVVTLILILGGHRQILEMLKQSVVALPVCKAGQCSAALGMDWAVLFELAFVAASALRVGVQLAAPVIVSALLIDLAAAFLAKATPKINVSFEVLPLKTICGLLIVGLSLTNFDVGSEVLQDSMSFVHEMLRASVGAGGH